VRHYADEFLCPLAAGVITRVLWELFTQDRPGLDHLGGHERLSRWDTGQALLARYPDLHGRLVKRFLREHRGALSPEDLSVKCEKIQNQLSLPLPGQRDRMADWTPRGADLWDDERSD
jgi:dTDP-4-dehydrorhamnose reductase